MGLNRIFSILAVNILFKILFDANIGLLLTKTTCPEKFWSWNYGSEKVK